MIGRHILSLVLALVLSGCTCGSDSDNKSSDQTGKSTKKIAPSLPQPILEMKQLADEMCACTNKSCAQDASRRYMQVVRAHGRLKLPRREARIMVEHRRRLNDCLKRALH